MIVGIDLGTTHSLVGHFSAEGPRLFPNALGDFLTPSVVSLDDEGRVIVGRAAADRLLTHPDRTVATFKRWMGSARETRLGERSFRPEELSALVIRSLLADVESATGVRPEEAVISVPAYFSDTQRRATRTAGELAGIRVERLINEPTAAALAYGLDGRDDARRFLVFDLGGGTFDVSIMEQFDGVMQVHASAGDNFLGGEDFTQALIDACLDELRLSRRVLSGHALAQLRQKLELAKRGVGRGAVTKVPLVVGDRHVEWTLDDDRFARIVEPLMQRLRRPVEQAMRDARLGPADLDDVLLVGGATRMPEVSRMTTRMFGRLPLRHLDPDQTIGLGASIAAGMKARDALLEEVILTDVCPYSLGIAVSIQTGPDRFDPGHFQPLIERNSPVPVSRVDRFSPVREEHTRIDIHVYQGESARVSNNIHLGSLLVKLPRPGRDNAVDVRFTYDIDGLLQVEATVVGSGVTEQLVIENNPGFLTPGQIAERLAALSALKLHPREQQQNLATISRAERMYEESLGDARRMLQQWLGRFTADLDTQDLVRIDASRAQFEAAMDEFERMAPTLTVDS